MKKSLLLLMIMPLALNGCALGMAAGVGASAGIAAAQEGGINRAVNDAKIQAEINRLWFEYNVDMFTKLDLTITQGRVLITGIVQSPEARVEAVRLAWQPKGVKQVINEIRVAKSEGVTGYARDAWITTRLRSALTFDRNIQAINYSIDTVQGTVYLMGFAQNQKELNRVLEKARTIPDVKQVVSYVKLVGDQTTYTPDGPEQQPQRLNSSGAVGDESYVPPADDMSGGGQPVMLVPEPVEREQIN